MAQVVRAIGQALVGSWIFARRTATGLLILLGALGVVSPVAGWAYVWLASGVNPLVYPEFWRTPVRSILTLVVVGLVFVPIELLGAVLEFSGTPGTRPPHPADPPRSDLVGQGNGDVASRAGPASPSAGQAWRFLNPRPNPAHVFLVQSD